MSQSVPRLGLLLKATMRLLSAMYQQLFLFFLLYNILNVVLLGPLFTFLLNRLIEFNGSRAIGNFDIVNYLLSPMGICFLVIAGGITAVLIMAQMAGFMLLGQWTLEQEVPSKSAQLKYLGSKAKSLFGLSFAAVGTLLLIFLPTAGLIWLIKLQLLSEHDINYYLAVQPLEFWMAVGLVGLLTTITIIVVAVYSMVIALALPQILFSAHTVHDAFRTSLRLVTGYRFRLMFRSVQIAVCWIFLVVIINGFVYFIGDLLLDLTGHGPLELISLAVVFGIDFVVATMLGFVALGGAASVVLLLWRHLSGTTIRVVDGFKVDKIPHEKVVKLAAASVLVSALLFMFMTIDSLDFEEQVLNVAHRGGAKLGPENTLSAIKRSIAKGAEAVEIDVQRTVDGAIVVIHDQDTMRVAGKPLKVSSSNLQELRTLDVGNWFSPEYGGEVLPMLEEVLLEVNQARVGAFVELKSYDDDRERLVHEVIGLLKKLNMIKGFVIISLNYDELQMVREHYPEFETGYLASAAIGDLTRLDADFLAVSSGVLSDAMIAILHAEERKICVWTIDKPELMHSMINRGVDCIITDRPDILAEVITDRKNLSSSELLLLRFGEIYR